MANTADGDSGANLGRTTRPWLRRARKRAEGYVDRPERIGSLLDAATKKLKAGDSNFLGQFWYQLRAVLRLLSAWWKGDYRNVSRGTIVTLLAAVIYFVMPIDAIPDWIVGVGFLDDAWVLGWAVNAVRQEVDEFLRWEAARAV
ncbi:MAG TPA: YkvA family protein [Vicinamibacterales bacterium]|jgi:uncharacterized membrane protein YkvA (DUF1232 family)|nr:YkvA family protein [Vicinamibacterales bacterium]